MSRDRFRNLEILGFSNYDVGDRGVVRNARTKDILKTITLKNGSVIVQMISDEGKRTTKSLAKMVCELYLSKPTSITRPTPMHKNLDPQDNRYQNLCWRDRTFINRYQAERKARTEPLLDRSVYSIGDKIYFPNSREAAESYGILETHMVNNLLNGSRIPYMKSKRSNVVTYDISGYAFKFNEGDIIGTSKKTKTA